MDWERRDIARGGRAEMTIDKKPWLFLKRVSTWSPLGNAKEFMPVPLPAAGPVSIKERKAWKLRARWSLED